MRLLTILKNELDRHDPIYLAPKFVRDELDRHDPVHLVCLAQIIVMVVMVAGLLILEG